MKNKKILISILIIIAIASLMLALLNSCAGSSSAEEKDNSLEPTIYKNKIIVGSDTSYPPFEFVQEGKIVGFDIDLVKEIAAILNKELEITTIKWDSTYNIPEDVDVDLIISAVPIIEEKKELIDFSDPYFTVEYLLISLKETQIKIKENLYGKKIGLLKTSDSDFNAEILAKYEVIIYEDILVMIDDFKNKNIEGILVSLPIAVNLLKENSGIFSVLEVLKSDRQFGMVFKKGSILKEDINQALQEITVDGTYEDIYHRWFEY